jgi:hypothetical protein
LLLLQPVLVATDGLQAIFDGSPAVAAFRGDGPLNMPETVSKSQVTPQLGLAIWSKVRFSA